MAQCMEEQLSLDYCDHVSSRWGMNIGVQKGYLLRINEKQ